MPAPASRLLIAVLAAIVTLIGKVDVARSDDAATTTMKHLLQSADPIERAIALDRLRYGIRGAGRSPTSGDQNATRAFADLLADMAPDRQAELVAALGERGDSTALPSIMRLFESSTDARVRSACLIAFGELGGVEAARIVALLERSLTAQDPEKTAARRALVQLRGPDVSRVIVAAISDPNSRLRTTMIDVAADRRETAALPALLAAAVGMDAGVRSTAMRALSKLGGAEQVKGMVAGLLAATVGNERNDAERALAQVCKQNPGHEQSADRFLDIFKTAGDEDRKSLLPVLGRIGGPGALAIVDELVGSGDPSRRAFGLEALTKWPDATVADRLLKLIAETKDPKERDLFLSALIRIAPLPDNTLNDAQKLDLLKKAMGLCQQDADRTRVLERANAIRTIEAFRFVLPYVDQPTLAEPACRSIVELAHHQKLRDAHKEEFVKGLDKVIAITKDAENIERAGRYKEGKTWERKKS